MVRHVRAVDLAVPYWDLAPVIPPPPPPYAATRRLPTHQHDTVTGRGLERNRRETGGRTSLCFKAPEYAAPVIRAKDSFSIGNDVSSRTFRKQLEIDLVSVEGDYFIHPRSVNAIFPRPSNIEGNPHIGPKNTSILVPSPLNPSTSSEIQKHRDLDGGYRVLPHDSQGFGSFQSLGNPNRTTHTGYKASANEYSKLQSSSRSEPIHPPSKTLVLDLVCPDDSSLRFSNLLPADNDDMRTVCADPRIEGTTLLRAGQVLLEMKRLVHDPGFRCSKLPSIADDDNAGPSDRNTSIHDVPNGDVCVRRL
ncbi:uncharacterized protein EV420DRAFT_1753693 [Desarmillaria tabescens]|uniref:Uncharacterized protein n=1 Tax=Armillaria tabescens TaxID=1929756 RepID=A0AA39MK96_ARMTA|nr:uncharacterized protein EV420DRAFT_1753693 [Desarmillaria tabescens]KAK0436804.1 hypothetical protein EV420DRAFT_1753693 [Desarmillaria tabescens]